MSFFRPAEYDTTGHGVDKNAPKKRRIFVFFELYFRKFWKLIELNFLWLINCLPIITIGPATAGMFKVLRSFALEKNSYMLSDFYKAYKANFKKSLLFGIVNTLILASVICSFILYPQLYDYYQSYAVYIPFVITLSVGFVLLLMNYYIFLMLIATDISTKNILKNSFFLAGIAIKKNVLTTVICGLILGITALVVYCYPITCIILVFFPFSTIAFIVTFNSYPVIQKYVINPYYEERGEVNPELPDYSPEEAIFTDIGSSEVQVKQKPSGADKAAKPRSTRAKRHIK